MFECPHCGADVVIGAKVCKMCGSDAETGWQSEAEIDYQSVDIPEGWGPGDERPAAGQKRWWVAAVAILVAVLLLMAALRFVLW